MGKRIAELPRLAAVYTSPLERARETAEAIARARGLRAPVDEAFGVSGVRGVHNNITVK